MSCNCPDTNKCSSPITCLCGIEMKIYDTDGNLIETVNAIPKEFKGDLVYIVNNSTAFQPVLGQSYTLIIRYNEELNRWEITYYNVNLDQVIVLGVYYGSYKDCPLYNCWDMDCIALGFSVLGILEDYFCWNGTYINDKKSYTFQSDWSGSVINYSLSWGLAPVSAGAPEGTYCWSLYNEDSDSYAGYLFNSNKCPFGVYLTGWNQAPSRFSFIDLGVTGYDVKTSAVDCGCCDESLVIDITYNDVTYEDVTATVVKDEYGNVLAINGKQYYSFILQLVPYSYTFYLYYTGTSWIMSDTIDGEGSIYAELISTNECPFGFYTFPKGPVTSFYVLGAECFDCCDYYTPRNRNLLKKKKAIFVEEISAIRNQEIFGLKCGGSWDDLFRKHLIFDVLNCLPYGVLCEEEEQCLINNLNENCNC